MIAFAFATIRMSNAPFSLLKTAGSAISAPDGWPRSAPAKMLAHRHTTIARELLNFVVMGILEGNYPAILATTIAYYYIR